MNNYSSLETSLQNVLDRAVDRKKIHGTSFALKKDSFIWAGCSGDLTGEQPYFIASTTKLFTTAVVLKLCAKGWLHLDNKISAFLNKDILQHLHVYNGIEYSYDITIRQLLSHTSGLPDYFQEKTETGKRLFEELIHQNDRQWNFEQVIEITKNLKPKFVPGTKNKAYYSDTNFQIVGAIIEKITGKSYAQNCQELITNPLGLYHTYLYLDQTDQRPRPIYYKTTPLNIPRAMSSFGPDGGFVSTSREMLVFMEAFFTGKLFPVSYIRELQIWNKIFFPMKAGIGIQLFQLPWFVDPLRSVPSFIGHSGLSGALAFYVPDSNLFISGTVNQAAYPALSFRLMVKLTQIILKNLQ